jgi:two-component system, chemotaxis family, sensor kinase CheA
MSIDLSQFHDAFFEEALVSLDQAEDDLLLLEKGSASTDNIDSAFRAIHSIKGSAGSLGFLQMGQLAHELENVLDDIRSVFKATGQRPSDDQGSVLLAALDLLRSQVGNAQRKNGDVVQSRVDALIGKLRVFGDLENDAIAISKDEQLDEDAALTSFGATPNTALKQYQIRFSPKPEMLACGNEPLRYLDALTEMGQAQVCAFWNDNADINGSCQLSWSIELETVKPKSDIIDLFSWIDDVCIIAIVEQITSVEKTDATELTPRRRATDVVEKNPTPVNRNTRSIQVQSEKIDALLGQLGELAIAQTDIENRVADQEVIELFQRLTRQTSQLQDAILAMRLSPIKILFRRFERTVRDAEIELGKQVHLSIEGDENQLDSSIIERLIDPLTHLIRNALDHGIETPEVRVAQGKEPYAVLSLIAEQKASVFVIQIQDDGNGLSIDNIRHKAIEKGLAKNTDVKTPAQWAQMIFKPGFSTATQISQWSGRGVGLDAVAAALSQLNGRIDLTTTPGKGTTITIALPLTMAISDALIVECAGERYAIPMSAVTECLYCNIAMIHRLPNQQRLFKRREQLLPYACLAELMQLQDSKQADLTFSAVVISNGRDEAVLRVSQIIGQKQIVIKNIEKNLGPTKYCSSATLLGDSQVVFVLDSGQIIRDVGQLETIEAFQ